MEWISVNDELPENGKQVLTLLEGYFGSPDNLLCQKSSYRVFQSTFHRFKGVLHFVQVFSNIGFIFT